MECALTFPFLTMNNNQIYSIPTRFRRIENLHILLWLLKDVCWALNFHIMGMIMIIPTVTVAVVIPGKPAG